MKIEEVKFNQSLITDIPAVVVGLYGDPCNQSIEEGEYGVDKDEAFSCVTSTGSTLKDTLIWSRLILCELLYPNDSTYEHSRLALVLKPRTLWLYESGSNVKDFDGNEDDPLLMEAGSASLVEVNPMYNFGDIIRVAGLPMPLTIDGWTDGYPSGWDEEYKQGGPRQVSITGLTSISVVGGCSTFSDYASYINESVAQIFFYDKNVDARTRIVGSSSGSSGGTVTVSLCVGGVIQTYSLRGTRIS